MPSTEEKQRRKELLQGVKTAAESSLQISLPVSASQLKALFDYLDDNLTEGGCDDTLRFTRQFTEIAQLPFESLKVWVEALGGYCDCEVLANVEEKVEGLL
jgi:hypothetical protein